MWIWEWLFGWSTPPSDIADIYESADVFVEVDALQTHVEVDSLMTQLEVDPLDGSAN